MRYTREEIKIKPTPPPFGERGIIIETKGELNKVNKLLRAAEEYYSTRDLKMWDFVISIRTGR